VTVGVASGRAERLAALIGEQELDSLIVSGEANLRYMTGFSGSSAIALVAADGEARFLTDFRYKEQSAIEVDPVFEREIISGEPHDALAATLRPGRVGFDDAVTSVAELTLLERGAPAGVELVAAGRLVAGLRAVKDDGEIELIAAAAALVDSIYEWLVERGFAGRTERAVALALEHEMRVRGASGPSFGSIVASGPHAALPHAQPRDVAIERGTLVTVDIGALLDGYCSDCTRTFAVGEPSSRAREVYELVLSAQLAGLEALAPGRDGVAVDADARAVIDGAGFGDYYRHGLGHGVGLEIHEPPRLSQHASLEPLVAGNVVTVEPGIYLPGELGVRIEDLVVLSDDGARRLSQFTKELLVVD
jgi:Xaa-Pro aminopeptidase